MDRSVHEQRFGLVSQISLAEMGKPPVPFHSPCSRRLVHEITISVGLAPSFTLVVKLRSAPAALTGRQLLPSSSALVRTAEHLSLNKQLVSPPPLFLIVGWLPVVVSQPWRSSRLGQQARRLPLPRCAVVQALPIWY